MEHGEHGDPPRAQPPPARRPPDAKRAPVIVGISGSSGVVLAMARRALAALGIEEALPGELRGRADEE